MNSSGDITRCVVPSRQGVLSFSTTCPAALHCTRSSASAGRGDGAAQLVQQLAVVASAAYGGVQAEAVDVGAQPGCAFQPVFFHPNYPTRAQPIEFASAYAPASFGAAPVDDKLVNPARSTKGLAAKLQAAGVPVMLRMYERASHMTLGAAVAQRPSRVISDRTAPRRWPARPRAIGHR